MTSLHPEIDRLCSGGVIERRIGESAIYFPSALAYFLVDYYGLILSSLTELLRNNPVKKLIILGVAQGQPIGGAVTRIAVHIEHTLVLPGGRDAFDAPLGNIVWNNKRYLVRLNNSQWDNCEYITEYSIPNISNVGSLEAYHVRYSHKILYVPPLVYDYARAHPLLARKHDLVTTFVDCSQPRRYALLQRLKENHIGADNFTNLHAEALRQLLLDTRIVLNIHQTDQHHTFEELRVLPCLLCKVIVIAEDSPLKERIPYCNYVVWTTYENIVETVRATLANYSSIYERFYGADSDLPRILDDLKAGMELNLKALLK